MTNLKRRKATAAQWAAQNPILKDDEVAINTDDGKFKLGDGGNRWAILPYAAGAAGGSFDPETPISKITFDDTTRSGDIEIAASYGGVQGLVEGSVAPFPVGPEGIALVDSSTLTPSILTVQDGVLRIDGIEVMTYTPEVTARMLPVDGSQDMLLSRDTSGDTVGKWTVKDPLGKYRGTWGPDEEVYFTDFGSGFPTEFTTYQPTSLIPTNTVEAMSVNTGTSKPAYANVAKISVPTSGGGLRAGLVMDVSNVGSVTGKTVTRVKYWEVTTASAITNKTFEALENGVLRQTENLATTALPWEEHTLSLTGGVGKIQWQIKTSGNTSGTSIYYLAGVRVYATTTPYLYGDTVDYAGKLYRSNINNNSDTPGTGVASWELITYP